MSPFAKEIQYLGHILSETGIKSLPLKTESIKVMKPLRNVKQVWTFLGLVGYYCKFIKNFAHMVKPLTTLTQHNVKFTWTQMFQAAFETLKGALIRAPILHYPDPSKCSIAYGDASNDTCGAQLSQDHYRQELPVMFLSHTFR